MSWPARSCHQLSVCMGDSPQAATMIRKRKTASSLSKVANPNYSTTIQTVLRYLTGRPSFRAGLNSHAFAALSIIDARTVDRFPSKLHRLHSAVLSNDQIDPGERVRIYAAWQLSRQLRPHTDRRRDAPRAGRVDRAVRQVDTGQVRRRPVLRPGGGIDASGRAKVPIRGRKTLDGIGRPCRERVLSVGQGRSKLEVEHPDDWRSDDPSQLACRP